MKSKRIFYMIPFIVVLFIVCSFSSLAVQTGTAKLIYMSKLSDCSAPFYNNFTAGEAIYLKMNLTNTGTENLMGTRLFTIDSISYNFGVYTSPVQYVDINTGESLIICFAHPTKASYKPGQWLNRFYFRNSVGVDLHVPTFYFNISNTGSYSEIQLTHNLTNPTVLNVGESIDGNLTIRNHAPTPFTGIVYTNAYLKFKDTGLTTKNIVVPALTTVNYEVTTVPIAVPTITWFGIYLDDTISGQRMILTWPVYQVAGDYYRYRLFQLYSNQTIYDIGAKGFISANVYNYGNTQWNTTSCKYRWRVRAKDGASWVDVYDQTFNFNATHLPGALKWYDSPEFTNPFSHPMEEFYVYLYIYKPDGVTQMDVYDSYYTYYAPPVYPVATCSYDVSTNGTQGGLVGSQQCTSTASGATFIPMENAEFKTLKVIAPGTMSFFWEGEKDGQKGFFIRGSPNAQYEAVYYVAKVFELPAFKFSYLFLLMLITVYIGLFIRYNSINGGRR